MRSRLNAFLTLARAWPVCLTSATVAYLTLAGLLLFLAPDIALLIVNGVPTLRLVLAGAGAFLLLNMLLALTYAASLFAIRRENIMGGLRKNSKKLMKGFMLLSVFSLAGIALMFSTCSQAFSSTSLAQGALWLIAMNYGAGVIASVLLAISLVWLLTSLAGGRLWIGFGRLLSTIALFFLMLAILSAYGLPGLFIDSMLIPTVTGLIVPAGEKALENKAQKNVKGNRLFHLKGRSIRKASAALVLITLVLSAEIPFGSILLAFGEEARFSEDRLKTLVSKAIAEGWSSGELASEIRKDPGLSMLSTYDLGSITIERDDGGNVIVTIPLNAMGYAIYRKTSNRTTVYDVYSQGGSGEVSVGDKRYVLTGYRSSEETYGPFESLDEALARENEAKKNANATRIASNTVLKTETREITRVETRYAIVPTVMVERYEVLKEFENYWDAQSYLYSRPGIFDIAEVKEVVKNVWVYSYRLEFVKETANHYEAVMMSRDGYLVEEVRERVVVYVFEKRTPLYLGPIYLGHYYAGEERIRRDVFERMVETGQVKTG
ncbi:MAG: hypothetical protein ACPL4E_11050, partial [Thermoproteota archaeon]